ncbi:MAG: hypothetical protein FJW35_19015 [Acidobacteria bacterium]|nr:hypothetical protein [Acidobacteriota bacterium]
MKTTVEIPDTLDRRAKAMAASQGHSFRALLGEALQARVDHRGAEDRPWMKVFAGTDRDADFGDEMLRIAQAIEDEFEQLEPEDRL